MKGAVAIEPVDWCFINIRHMQLVGLEKTPSTKNNPTNGQRLWYFPLHYRHHDGHIKKFFGVNHSGADTLRDLARSANF